MGAKSVCLSVYLYVCLSARISQKPHELHQIYLHVVYDRTSIILWVIAIRYVLPAMWMT